MSRRSRIVVFGGLLSLAAMAAPAWADLRIAVVNYTRLMQESPQAKAAQEALRGEFAGKQKELQTAQAALKSKEESLQKDGATMTVDQRTKLERDLRDGNRDLSQRVTAYQDDFNARQNEELSRLQKALVEEVQTYAQAEKFDLVLADGVIFASPTLDITPQVLTALQAHGVRPAATTGSTAAPASGPKPASTPNGK
jgi:outer membrane protein